VLRVHWRELQQYRALGYIGTVSVIGMVAFFGVLTLSDNVSKYFPSLIWVGAWFSLIFYLSWWVVYYGFSAEPEETTVESASTNDVTPDHSVTTLRTFLRYHTPRGRSTSRGESLAYKAGNTMQAVGAIIGFALLVFSVTVQFLFDSTLTRPIHVDILTGVLVAQIFAIASLLIAIDSLDSTMNEFVFFQEARAHRRRKTFYDRGIRAYYRGLVVLVLSMFLLTMLVQPLVTIFGVFTFSAYGYHYWFGYEVADD
jgi:hypothetical protein